MKGLLVEIMGTDCTNNGVTSGHRQALLVGRDIPELFGVSTHPVLELHIAPGVILGPGRKTAMKDGSISRVYAKPVGAERRGMMGGHWIISSDSRFPAETPIAVHDRYE